MEISSKNITNDISLIEISGEIDLYNCDKIQQAILDKLKEGFKKIILNLSKVNYIDSSGIGKLIYCKTTISQQKGYFVIIEISETIKRIFDLTKLTSYFTIFDSEVKAKEFLEGK